MKIWCSKCRRHYKILQLFEEKDQVKLFLGPVVHRKANYVSRALLKVAIPKLPNGVNVKYYQTPSFQSTKRKKETNGERAREQGEGWGWRGEGDKNRKIKRRKSYKVVPKSK